ncbi:MAG: MCE family protein [Verrucomicrobiales bacterium]|nr:MCE family protein [Verrucomicrobiales bacterium]
MSQKTNPTLIGIFIVAGLALGVIGLAVFGSGNFFTTKEKLILYFESSMKGLNAGAPVKWRGVTIGSVYEVLLRHNQATNDFANPVIVQIDMEILAKKSDQQLDLENPGFLKERIRQGLRGRLDAESLVTGVLYVELDMVADAPPPVFHQIRAEYPEIPTVPTSIQELLANLGRVDFRGISDKLNALLGRLDESLAALDLKKINHGVTTLLESANSVLATPDLTNSLTELRLTLVDARRVVDQTGTHMAVLSASATNTLAEADRTLRELRRGIEGLSGMVGPDTPFRTDATLALEQISNAARALAELAEFLQRNPNALLTGRKPPEKSP